MADCEEIQAGHAQRKAAVRSQSLSGPFFRIPSPSSLKQAIVIHKAAIFCLFAADAILKGLTPCLHLHALCGATGTRKYEREGMAVEWRNTPVLPHTGLTMPTEVFFLTEVHMGGCGYYTSSDRWTDANGTAIGFR